jgi:hypothetical protein
VKNPSFPKTQFSPILTDVFTLNSDPICQTLGMVGLPGIELTATHGQQIEWAEFHPCARVVYTGTKTEPHVPVALGSEQAEARIFWNAFSRLPTP